MSNSMNALIEMQPLVQDLQDWERYTLPVSRIFRINCQRGLLPPPLEVVKEYAGVLPDVSQTIRELELDIRNLCITELSEGSSLRAEKINEYIDEVEWTMVLVKRRIQIIEFWMRGDDGGDGGGDDPIPLPTGGPYIRLPIPAPVISA